MASLFCPVVIRRFALYWAMLASFRIRDLPPGSSPLRMTLVDSSRTVTAGGGLPTGVKGSFETRSSPDISSSLAGTCILSALADRALNCDLRVAISILGRPGNNHWEAHNVDDFVPHGVQHQFHGGMKVELHQDVAAMRFRCL